MLAAQVFTAKDLIVRGTSADLRVAVLLLDSTLETLMVRKVRQVMQMQSFAGDEWWRKSAPIKIVLSDFRQRERVSQELGEKYPNWVLSKNQRQSIDRNFGAKLQFLIWLGDIPAAYLKVASRLHDYRNELYHRDHTRHETLSISALISAYVVAEFLKLLKPLTVGYGADADATLAEIFDRAGLAPDEVENVEIISGYSIPQLPSNFDLQVMMGAQLMKGLDDRLHKIPQLLADYIRERLAATDRSLDLIGGWNFDDQPHTKLDVIRLLHKPRGTPLRDLRGLHTSVTKSTLERWNGWPEKISVLTDALEAFASLSDFESEFETFEVLVDSESSYVDGAISFELDRRRGK